MMIPVSFLVTCLKPRWKPITIYAIELHNMKWCNLVKLQLLEQIVFSKDILYLLIYKNLVTPLLKILIYLFLDNFLYLCNLFWSYASIIISLHLSLELPFPSLSLLRVHLLLLLITTWVQLVFSIVYMDVAHLLRHWKHTSCHLPKGGWLSLSLSQQISIVSSKREPL